MAEDTSTRVELANLLLPAYTDQSHGSGSGGAASDGVVLLEARFETCSDLLENSAPTQIQAVVDLEKLSELVGVPKDEFVNDLQQQVSDQLQLNDDSHSQQDSLFVDPEQDASERDRLLSPHNVSDRVALSADAFVDTLTDVLETATAVLDDNKSVITTDDVSVPHSDRMQLANHAFLLEMPNDGGSEQPHFILALPETYQDDISETSNESFLHGLSFLPSDVEDVQLEATATVEAGPGFKHYHPSIRLDVVVKRRVPTIGYVILITGLLALSSVGAALNLQGHNVSPMMKTYWRLTATVLVLAPLAVKSLRNGGWPQLDKTQWTLFVICALCYAFMTAAFVIALDLTTLVNAFVLSDLAPLFIIVGRFLQGLPILYTEGLGAAIGFLGGTICALDLSNENGGGLLIVAYPNAVTGDFLAVLASVALAGYLVIAKKLRTEVDLFVFMFFLMLMSSFFILAYMLGSGETLQFSNHPVYGLWGWMNLTLDRLPLEIYLAVVCNVLGTTGYIAVMKYFEPVVVSTVMLMEPVLGALMGVAAGLDPLPGIQTWIGDGVVTIGIFLVIWSGARTTETIDATEALLQIGDNSDNSIGGVPLLKNPVVTKSPHRSKPTPLARMVIWE